MLLLDEVVYLYARFFIPVMVIRMMTGWLVDSFFFMCTRIHIYVYIRTRVSAYSIVDFILLQLTILLILCEK